MNTPEEQLLRSAVGMLAHINRELVGYVGLLNAETIKDSEIQKGAEELFALATSITDSFPPDLGALHSAN